jgi:hypothetical protein
MRAQDSELTYVEIAKANAIDEALGRLGDQITEVEARRVALLEDCECKDGMFALAATRRQTASFPIRARSFSSKSRCQLQGGPEPRPTQKRREWSS